MSSARLRILGIVLSVVWIAVAGLYGYARATVVAHRGTMLCYRMQAQAKADPKCAAPDAVPTERLCFFKTANCQSPIDPQDLASTAAVSLGPPAVLWLLAFARRSRKRRAAA